MSRKFVIETVPERLARWRELKAASEEAYARLKAAGQASSGPEFRDLALKARLLRDCADREFAAITSAVKPEESGPD